MGARQPRHPGALLTIDLGAICDNWRALKAALAGRAGTIGYEILTSLGNRYARSYVS